MPRGPVRRKLERHGHDGFGNRGQRADRIPGRHHDTVRAPHGAFQPIAAADVATALTPAAIEDPTNGVINIAGPEKQGMDDFIRARFTVTGDARRVITDAGARYYGAVLDDRSIVPVAGEDVVVYSTTFSDWMAHHRPVGADDGAAVRTFESAGDGLLRRFDHNTYHQAAGMETRLV